MSLETPPVCPDRTAAPLPADVFEAIVAMTAAAIVTEMRAGSVVSPTGRNRVDGEDAELGQIPADEACRGSQEGAAHTALARIRRRIA
jgi:hypothetical protein